MGLAGGITGERVDSNLETIWDTINYKQIQLSLKYNVIINIKNSIKLQNSNNGTLQK